MSSERSQVATGWRQTDVAATIPEHFARQAARYPDHPAIAAPEWALTYAELDGLAARYVAWLCSSATPGDRIALLLRHDADLVASALAALRLACAVVVLNPIDPPARLAQILTDAEPAVLLTDGSYWRLAQQAAVSGLRVELISAASALEPAEANQPPPSPDDLAFLISTSGSTGKPKLVMQTHRGMLHQVLRYTTGLGIDHRDRVSLLLSLSGGRGLGATWTTLLGGATLCPFPTSERGVAGLAAWLEDQRVTVFDTLPSILRSLARTLPEDRRISGVRLVRLASEPAYKRDFEAYRRHFPLDSVLVHGLASSEAGMIAFARIRPGDTLPDGPLPVGRVADGLVIRLLDERSRPVPPGEVGEIVVGGGPLARGYWRDRKLTDQRFRAVDGERWLYTGDLAKSAPDGSLTIVGRADTQIKIRGYRVQLEEVEAALAAHPDVSAAAVALRTTERGNAQLTAYVCAAPGRTPAVPQLRRSLQATLPPYAVPARFVAVESLPLNANGKIDRGRLPEPAPAAGVESDDLDFASQTEAVLASVWSDALELDHIDPNATFFELGGDSLIAAAIATDLEDQLGVEVDFRAFAADPTIKTLAAHVEEVRQASVEGELQPLRKAPRIGPLSFAQTRFLRYRSITGPDIRWNMVVPFRIRGALDVTVFQEALNLVVARHEILRTSYVEWDGVPMAIVRPPEPAKLPIHDLRSDPDPNGRIQQIAEHEQRTPFDLENGPLLRLTLFRLGDEDYRLLRASHHIIHDAAESWTVFFDEIAQAYLALLEGRPIPFSTEPEIQYLDYAFSERASSGSRTQRYRAEVDWWERELEAPRQAVELPFTRPAPLIGERLTKEVIEWGLPAEHSAALDEVSRASRATYYMSRLAVFAALLAIETASDDLVIGTPLSTRNRAELQSVIGPFINFRILRLRFRDDPSLRDWLADVRRTVVDVVSHSSIPWEQLTAELKSRGVRPPRLTARFLTWWAMPPMEFGGLALEPLPKYYGEAWGFRLVVNPQDEAERCWAVLDPRVYDPDRVRGFLSRLKALVAAACAQPEHSLRDLHRALPHG
jgi:amino acid adenylation domain-containing protein